MSTFISCGALARAPEKKKNTDTPTHITMIATSKAESFLRLRVDRSARTAASTGMAAQAERDRICWARIGTLQANDAV